MRRTLLFCLALFSAALLFVAPAHAAKKVDIAVVVDVLKATSTGYLGEYVYMVDTQGNVDSGQGGHELTTNVESGTELEWTVYPIDPDNTVSIVKFTGTAIGQPGTDSHLVQPKADTDYPAGDGNYTTWGGRVEGFGDHVQYSIELALNGKKMSFDPFITSSF